MLAIKYSVNIINKMKRVLAGVLLVTSLCFSGMAYAAQNDVLITTVQTESVTSASEEFVVITNNTPAEIEMSGWHIQYFSAAATNFDTPTRNILLNGALGAHASFMAASSGYKVGEADFSFGAGLAASGGHIRLTSGSGAGEVQHDLLAWGNAIHPETAAIGLAAKGQIYQRKTTTGGIFVDTDNNSQDFNNGQGSNSSIPPEPVVTVPGSGTPAPVEPINSLAYPVITELLPNPAAPATDAEGEFVELYNPNSEAINLAGYKLQTGSNNTYSYTFKDGSLAAGEYRAFYSKNTKLVLSNTSGKARLLSISGKTVSETASYTKASTGSSWSLYGSSWGWTTTPSPGEENAAPVEAAAGAVKSATVTRPSKTNPTKSKASPRSSNPKSKALKATKAAAAKNKPYKNPAKDNQPLPVSPLLLAAVGVPLIGYMVYEYRTDLANFIAKLRRNRSVRSQTRV